MGALITLSKTLQATQADVISYSAAIGACSKVREWLQAVEHLGYIRPELFAASLRAWDTLYMHACMLMYVRMDARVDACVHACMHA